MAKYHIVHWDINHPPPSKTLHRSFLPSPTLKSANSPSPPPFLAMPPLYFYFCEPPAPLKTIVFKESQNYYSFSSLTPSQILSCSNQILIQLELPLNIS